MSEQLDPSRIMPAELRDVVDPLPYWFVIGGNAVRCLVPYRPTRDVDFGVREADSLDALLAELTVSGDVELLQKTADTVDLRWNGIAVSIFHLERIGEFTEGRRLNVEGMLATKLHAILDRGTRRDFFDLYVLLQHQQLGIADCLRALRTVYQQPVDDSLLLRAMTYFDDAEAEAELPGEGEKDWNTVCDFFLARVGQLLVPPSAKLEIQERRVDVLDE